MHSYVAIVKIYLLKWPLSVWSSVWVVYYVLSFTPLVRMCAFLYTFMCPESPAGVVWGPHGFHHLLCSTVFSVEQTAELTGFRSHSQMTSREEKKNPLIHMKHVTLGFILKRERGSENIQLISHEIHVSVSSSIQEGKKDALLWRTPKIMKEKVVWKRTRERRTRRKPSKALLHLLFHTLEHT